MSRHRRLLVASSCLLVLGLSPSLAGAQAPQREVGVNTRLADGDRSAARGREIPGLAANPADPRNIVEVDEDFLGGQCDYHASFDGGRTWTGGHLRTPAGFPPAPCVQFDSGGYAHSNGSVAWGSGRNVYTTFTSRRPNETESVLVARSRDGGRTFDPAVIALPGTPGQTPFLSRPRLAVRPRAGGDSVYVTAIGCDLLAACNRTAFGASNDSGTTWRTSLSVALPTEGITSSHSQPVVGADGTLYLALRRGTTAGGPLSLFLATSKDGGATWTYSDIPAPATPDHLKLAVDRQGGLFLALTTKQFAADTDIALLRRPAGSATWSAPLRVNDDQVGNGVVQRLPWLSVSATGLVEVLWHDRRLTYPGESLEDYYYAVSSDGGRTFAPNRRVTDRSKNLAIGLNGNVTGGFYWPALVSLGDGTSVAAWADSREGSFEDNSEDIYLSTIRAGGTGALPRQVLPRIDAVRRSVALSRLAYPGGGEVLAGAPATKVVIVREGDVAGLLAGSVLARASFGPVLVVRGSRLSPEVQAEVRRLRAVGAFVLGSTTALPAGVVSDLERAGVPRDAITRISGKDAADSARLVAQALDTRTAAQRSSGAPAFSSVVIVNPASAESAAAGAYAASLRLPVLVVGRDSVPAATREALKDLAVTSTEVIGGPAAISAGVQASLPGPERLGGRDSRATSLAVAAAGNSSGLAKNIAYVADGTSPADGALLAGTVARRGGLLLLNPGGSPALAERDIATLGLRASVDRLVLTSAAPASSVAKAGPTEVAPAGPAGSLPATGQSGPATLFALVLFVAGAVTLRRGRRHESHVFSAVRR